MTDTTLEPEAPFDPTAGISRGRVRWRQTMAVMRLHARRTLWSRRGVGLYILCLLPVGILTLRWFILTVFGRQDSVSLGAVTSHFSQMFHLLILAMVVFFGAAAVFSNAVRREVLERTLHFYFLMPVRREVLMAGLYLGGVLAMGSVVATTTLVSFVLAYLPAGLGPFTQFLFQGPGLGHLASYLLLAVVGVAGYGAVFFTLGLFFRRPALPVIGIFGWELLIPFLPPLLKKISIAYYLGALAPVPVVQDVFAVLAEYPSPWAAVLGLMVVIAALLALAGWKARRLEILYGED
jgi:hypothetical protein